MKGALLLSVGLLLSGCLVRDFDPSAVDHACTTDSDCLDGWTCRDRVCHSTTGPDATMAADAEPDHDTVDAAAPEC